MARPKTILLVDHDNAIIKFVTLILENEGYRVLTASDGEDALDKVRQARPDLLLLEIILPRKNGYQVCREVKEDKVLRTLPVVFLSAKSQPSDRFWAKRVGAEGFVAKPFDPGGLLREIRVLLRNAQLVSA
ncbi:MAG: response regulator [Candidatus Latescibacterota bacterium]|nr:MAG: response regulator [Candidatus Latescibacterota bacterium]